MSLRNDIYRFFSMKKANDREKAIYEARFR